TGISGVTTPEMIGKRLQMLKELAPRTTRIAFICTKLQQESYPSDAGPAGTRLVHGVVERPHAFGDAVPTVLRESADAIHLWGDSMHFNYRQQVLAFAAAHRLPASFQNREAVQEGGLIAYGADVANSFRQMARQVDRILRGAKPAEIPVELGERFDLVINRKTAQALGLTIPPVLEAMAEVIE